MTPKERFKGHFDFLDQLDEAIAVALKRYREAEESDLEELRHLQREVALARRTLGELCEKFAAPLGQGEARERALATRDSPAPEAKSAASV